MSFIFYKKKFNLIPIFSNYNVNKPIEVLLIIWYEMTLTDKKKYQDEYFIKRNLGYLLINYRSLRKK